MTTGCSEGDEWRDGGGALRRGVKGQGLGAEEKVNPGWCFGGRKDGPGDRVCVWG